MSMAQTEVISKQTAVQLVTTNVFGNAPDGRIIKGDIHKLAGDYRYQNVWQWVERKRDGLCDGYSNERFATAGAAACAAMRIAEADGAPVSSRVQAAMSRERLAGWELRFFGHEEIACRNELQLDGYKQRIQEELQEAIEREQREPSGRDLDDSPASTSDWPLPEEDFDPYRDALWDTYPRF